MDSKTNAKAVKSNTGKAVGRALKDQAISTGTNLLADIIKGNNLIEKWGTLDKMLLYVIKN